MSVTVILSIKLAGCKQSFQPASLMYIIMVNHIIELTMVDGKVATALTDLTNSSQCCSVCGTKPTQMNNIHLLTQAHLLPGDGFNYGLSTLHPWIHCMECVLHVSYKLGIRKHQARSVEDKVSVKLKKKTIQEQIKEQLGLVIEVPKSDGSGTSNDGNTGRRFFKNAQIVSIITGFDLC